MNEVKERLACFELWGEAAGQTTLWNYPASPDGCILRRLKRALVGGAVRGDP
jgi:hypothetical protein